MTYRTRGHSVLPVLRRSSMWIAAIIFVGLMLIALSSFLCEVYEGE
jgi:hypothetical protein